MKLISHRGNLMGKIPEKENTPNYIDAAISSGFDVEVDLWFNDGKFFLGHDLPENEIEISWIRERSEKLWIHAKNSGALENLMETDLHYFFHADDMATITSKGFVWVYPGKQPIKNSVAVLPELFDDQISQCHGVCSDYILRYK